MGKDTNLIRWYRVQFALLLLNGIRVVLMNNIRGAVIPTEVKLKNVCIYVVCECCVLCRVHVSCVV